MYLTRTIESSINKMSQSFCAIAVYGARQVGKSTTIRQLFGSKFKIISLDDIDERTLAIKNPKLFLRNNPWPLVVDEIQKAPNLLEEIKQIIDNEKFKNLSSNKENELMYVLSGSNKFELQNSISESLAGRCGIIEMCCLSNIEQQKIAEYKFAPDIDTLKTTEGSYKKHNINYKNIFEKIFKGGMPEVCANKVDRDSYYNSYIETYIERDVKQLINATSEIDFKNFMSILALRCGQVLNYNEISKTIGIDVRTCKRWISILRASGIIYLLEPYMSNMSKRIIKAPKLYFLDTGLATYLCKWPSAEILEKSAMNGAMFETFVVSELVKNLSSFGERADMHLFYYRDFDKREVDIIYPIGDTIYPIEIKRGINPVHADKNFNVLKKFNMKIMPGLIIHDTDKIRQINEDVYSLPVHLL